jgi:hypothetical protein
MSSQLSHNTAAQSVVDFPNFDEYIMQYCSTLQRNKFSTQPHL